MHKALTVRTQWAQTESAEERQTKVAQKKKKLLASETEMCVYLDNANWNFCSRFRFHFAFTRFAIFLLRTFLRNGNNNSTIMEKIDRYFGDILQPRQKRMKFLVFFLFFFTLESMVTMISFQFSVFNFFTFFRLLFLDSFLVNFGYRQNSPRPEKK